MRNIYLVGFMGCGKTTIGEQLALYQGKKFCDLDRIIVEEAGMPITTVFERYGEAKFRALESKCLQETEEERCAIIATGGGIVVSELNREFLKRQRVVFLKWPFEVLYERIKGDAKRPLAKSEDMLRDLYTAREKWYEEVATYVIDCEGHTPYSLSKLLMEQVK